MNFLEKYNEYILKERFSFAEVVTTLFFVVALIEQEYIIAGLSFIFVLWACLATMLWKEDGHYDSRN